MSFIKAEKKLVDLSILSFFLDFCNVEQVHILAVVTQSLESRP